MIAGLLAGAARLVVGSTIYWTETPGTDPRIYIANHSSHLDFIVLWALLPPPARARARPVAARDYWSTGIRHHLAENVFHAVLVDRGRGGTAMLPSAERASRTPDEEEPWSGPAPPSHEAIAQMVAALDEGSSLILFPEGTRGQSGELGPFRSGLYHLCKSRPEIPVVPVFMANLNRIMPKGAVIPAPLLGRVTMGAPLRIEASESKQSFLARTREAVAAMANA